MGELTEGCDDHTGESSLDGPLAFLYTLTVRKSIEQGLPDGVDRLAVMAAADG